MKNFMLDCERKELLERVNYLRSERDKLIKEINNLRSTSDHIKVLIRNERCEVHNLEYEKKNLNGQIRSLRDLTLKVVNGDDLSREQVYKVFPALRKVHKVNQRIKEENKKLEKINNQLNEYIDIKKGQVNPAKEIEYQRRLAILEQREKQLELKLNSPYETRRGDLQIIQNMLDYLEEHEVYDRQRKLIVELQEMIAVLFYRFGCSESYPIAAEMLEQYKVKTKYSSSKGDLPNISIDSISSDIQDIYTEIYGRRLDDSVVSDLKLLSKFKDTKGYLNRLFDEIKGK